MNDEPSIEQLVQHLAHSNMTPLGFRSGAVEVFHRVSLERGEIEVRLTHYLSGWKAGFYIDPVSISRAVRGGLDQVVDDINKRIGHLLGALQHNLLNEWVSTGEPPKPEP